LGLIGTTHAYALDPRGRMVVVELATGKASSPISLNLRNVGIMEAALQADGELNVIAGGNDGGDQGARYFRIDLKTGRISLRTNLTVVHDQGAAQRAISAEGDLFP